MKILLFGNPSMYHAYLAKGLREMGHEVTVIGHGFAWRQFPGIDITLERNQNINSKLAFIKYLWQTLKVLRHCKGYDIVQLHHPMFLELRGSHMKPFYSYLRKHNRCLVMCALGYDYHVLDQIYNHNILRYSEQRIGDKIMHDPYIEQMRELYLNSSYAPYSRYVAKDADAIVACLYEYWACYNNVYPDKLHYIPLQMVIPDTSSTEYEVGDKVKIFIGIQRERAAIKGTDIMLKAADDIVRNYPDLVELRKVENVPYNEYIKIMEGSDVILDQLYSYTPSMNSLLAMSKGIVVVGGGEPECYDILAEKHLRPIINVEPTYESVYNALKELILHKERIPELKRQSVEFVKKHHNYRKVAKDFFKLYDNLLSQNG